jgi:RNA polymerase sigma-32 factor
METTRCSTIASSTVRSREPAQLSPEQEAERCRRWRDERDEQAKHELLQSHLHFVEIIASKYQRCGIPHSELIAAGNVGVLRAADTFEPGHGLRFLTCAAYWIRVQILDTVTTEGWNFSQANSSSPRSEQFFKLRREKARITNFMVGL